VKNLTGPAFLCGIVLASHAPAMGATAKEVLPPPGLYRVDADSTFTRGDVPMELKQHRDGTTGAEHEQDTVYGKVSTSDRAGTGQVTQCIKPLTNDYLPAFAAQAQCPKQGQKVIGDKKFIHTAQCSDSQFTMEVTKLDDKHWQFVTRTETAAPTGVANVDGMEVPLKLMAQYGKTQQERDEAAKRLAALPAQKKALEQKQAKEVADMKSVLPKAKDPAEHAMIEKYIADRSGKSAPFVPGAPGNEVEVVKATWTRIADHCSDK